MKVILKKILLSIILIVILFNFIFETNVTYALTMEEFINFVTAAMGGIVSVVMWPFRIKVVAIAFLINELVTSQLASAGGGPLFITPYNIFFNNSQNKYVPITDINFFDFSNTDATSTKFKESCARWYYNLRTIAAGALMVVLVYIGIRMAISTLSEDKAKYKKMLVDWVMSIALLFLMQYIILFVIELNDTIVIVLDTAVQAADLQDVMSDLALRGLVGVGINSMTATMVYAGIVILTFAFLVAYINRMLKVGFLILISPLITITYALDKIKDNKSQALDTWLKEIIYTILIQPFHCIIYLSYISVCFKLITNGGTSDFGYTAALGDNYNQLVNAVLAIFCIIFIKEAEKIVRKIFGFKDNNERTSFGAGLATTAIVISQVSKSGKAARTVMSKYSNLHVLDKIKGDMNKLGNSNTKLGNALNKVTNSRVANQISAQFGRVAEKTSQMGKKVKKAINGYKNFKENKTFTGRVKKKLREAASNPNNGRLRKFAAAKTYNAIQSLQNLNNMDKVAGSMAAMAAAVSGEGVGKTVAAGAAMGKAAKDFHTSSSAAFADSMQGNQTFEDHQGIVDEVANEDEKDGVDDNGDPKLSPVSEAQEEYDKSVVATDKARKELDKEQDKLAEMRRDPKATQSDIQRQEQAVAAAKNSHTAALHKENVARRNLGTAKKAVKTNVSRNDVLQRKIKGIVEKGQKGEYKTNSQKEQQIKGGMAGTLDEFDAHIYTVSELDKAPEDRTDTALDLEDPANAERLHDVRTALEGAIPEIESVISQRAGVDGSFTEGELRATIDGMFAKLDLKSAGSEIDKIALQYIEEMKQYAEALRKHQDEAVFYYSFKNYEAAGGNAPSGNRMRCLRTASLRCQQPDCSADRTEQTRDNQRKT